ncbi:GerAB/ArcD/ProY family transporter [Paenibacillus filicis]|uniref:GerAB/ArcD/ProY family transporter n=1 Tax=Paenibacillus filicis TaxID=669464 RepID=A0ABU9DKV5_9BACL
MSKRMIFFLFLQIHLAAALSGYAVKIIESTDKGHWEPILAGVLLQGILVWVYLKGLSFSKGKDVVQIIKDGLGKWAGTLAFLPFVLFLCFHLILLARQQITEISIILLPDTPLWSTTLIFVAIFLYAASKGISVIARVSVAIFLLFMPFVLFTLLVSYRDFDFYNAFPLWDPAASFTAKPSFYVSMYAYTGFLFLGMLRLNKPVTLRELWPLLAILAVFYVTIVYVPLLTFGHETAVLLQQPTLMASDTIDLEWVVFDWLPTFFIVSYSALSILESAVTLWMATLLIRKLFLPLPALWLMVGIGVAVYALSLMIPNMQALNRFGSYNAFFSIYSMIMIPVLTIVSGLRKRRTGS